MVATDTVVGIVGAVVLVAVMAGVFVYEYNNAPETEDSVAEQQQHFEEDYAGLAALQDLDEDGTPNWNDTDIDGDGTDNANDTMLSRTIPVNANVAAPSPTGSTPFTLRFNVVNGTESFVGALTYSRGPGGVTPNVQGSLSGPSGFDTVQAASTNTGSQYTLSFNIQEPLPPGEYTLTLTQQPAGGLVPAGQAASVTGNLEIHYVSPEGGAHGH